MTGAGVRGIENSGERYAFVQANRACFSSGALQWEVSIALGRRRRRFAVAKAGERRDAGRKTNGIRRIPVYTYSMPDQESVLVNARVTVSGILEELPREPNLPPSPPATPVGERRLYLDRWVAVPVYRFDALAPEQHVAGPAVIESAMTAVLLRPGDMASVTAQGWLDIAIRSD
jgi:N-methylhydantoinase A/oxoprolinase/acetone carboxylase beta subunit